MSDSPRARVTVFVITSAYMHLPTPVKETAVPRHTPSAITRVIPSEFLSVCFMRHTVPVSYRSAGVGSSQSTDFWHRRKTNISQSFAASSAATENSRSTSKLRGMEGNATKPLVGSTGSVSFSAFSIYLGILSPFFMYKYNYLNKYTIYGAENPVF